MQINVKEFLEQTGIDEPIYPGKRFVHSCRQPGEYKSHCVVLDWRNPDKLRIEVKAGLTGKSLEPKQLKYYPVSFQSPTYVDIEIINDNDEGEDGEEGKGRASGGSGGKGLKKTQSLDELKNVAFSAFGEAIEKAAPELGKIVEMVIAGTKITAEAYGQVMEQLANEISHAKIVVTDLLAKAGDFVTKYEPPSFMKAKGDETAKYKYDREKNADIGFQRTLG